MCRRVSVNRDFLWRSVLLNSLGEEPLRSINISVLTQQEINSVRLLINCPIKILPLTPNADVCFIHSPRRADRASKATPFLFELSDVVLYPSQDCSMGEFDPTSSHHVAQVAIAELVGDIPPHA